METWFSARDSVEWRLGRVGTQLSGESVEEGLG